MKMLTKTIVICACLPVLGVSQYSSAVEIYADHFGYGIAFGPKRYTLRISAHDVEKSPKWLDSDNPPVSAKQARRLADQIVIGMESESKRFSEIWKRSEYKFLLLPMGDDKWLWIVNITWMPKAGDFSGQPPQLSVAVTMDGRAIRPVLAKDQSFPIPGAGDP